MMTLATIADEVDGRLDGDPNFVVDSLHSMHSACGRSLTFFAGQLFKQVRPKTRAGAILVKLEHAHLFPMHRIIVGDPYLAYAKASGLFAKECSTREVSSHAIVAKSATLGDKVGIGHFSVIGEQTLIDDEVRIGSGASIGDGVTIGENTIVEDRVVIMNDCIVGKNCVISSGAVIGSSGFGYALDDRKWRRIEQLGRVVIHDCVDIGANTTIDRGALDDTVIGKGVKLDNLIQIAHNVKIGEDTVIAGCVGIAGSARIGARCQIGGRASIMGHIEIADDVVVLCNTFVAKSIHESGEYAAMISAQPAKIWRKNLAVLRRLDRLRRSPADEADSQ